MIQEEIHHEEEKIPVLPQQQVHKWSKCSHNLPFFCFLCKSPGISLDWITECSAVTAALKKCLKELTKVYVQKVKTDFSWSSLGLAWV